VSQGKAIEIALAGAAGRMGRRIFTLAWDDPHFEVVAALESNGHKLLGADMGDLAGVGAKGLHLQDHTETAFDVLVDFSAPEGTVHWLDYCLVKKRPFVTGVTGHDAEQLQLIADAAKDIPVLRAPNMSVGVNLLIRLVEQAASVLDDAYDVEIAEAHHRFKVDAPSGTAKALLEAVCCRRGVESKDVTVHGRQGKPGQRPAGEVGVHALRMGNVVGHHEVHFGSLGEVITLGHQALTRDTFAAGALRAAAWIVNKPAGLYSMQDVLFGNGG
jgi:4-hydroxy-tetrahydrodipicolinate reductase